MANTWFQFKKFTIHQDRCAMKVTTDACLYGAWLAAYLHRTSIIKACDVGAGTGLLSLMVAQANPNLHITAIELAPEATEQARENVSASIFAAQITVMEQDVLQLPCVPSYPFIFSNPPFHEWQLTASNQSKNVAHHSAGLTLEALFGQVSSMLQPDGQFALLLPYYRKKNMLALANSYHFTALHGCDVRPSPRHEFFRTMAIFGKGTAAHISFSNMSIAGEREQYDPAFVQLLKHYYLKL